MASPRTHKVLLETGEEGRAVKLTARNNIKVLNWIPDAEYRESYSKGQSSNQRIMVPILGTKIIRAAYFDDWIVKVAKGFIVVKFDKTDKTIFFPEVGFPEESNKLNFDAWKIWLESEAK